MQMKRYAKYINTENIYYIEYFNFFSNIVSKFFPSCNLKVLIRSGKRFIDKNGNCKSRHPQAVFRVLNKELLIYLKKFAIENNLQVLDRKWNKIQYNEGTC